MPDHPLKQSISDAMKDAMRAKDKPRLGTIRLMLAELKRIEVDERIDIDDTRVIAILDKMIKQRRDSMEQFIAGNRQELADVEKFEIEVIKEFLPKPLNEAEISEIVARAVSETGASSMKEMGAVMALVRPQLIGRADMSVVSLQIKQQLA
jgi:uncharacterized protein